MKGPASNEKSLHSPEHGFSMPVLTSSSPYIMSVSDNALYFRKTFFSSGYWPMKLSSKYFSPYHYSRDIIYLRRMPDLGLVRQPSNTYVPALDGHSSHLPIPVMSFQMCSRSLFPLITTALERVSWRNSTLFLLDSQAGQGSSHLFFSSVPFECILLYSRMSRTGLVWQSPPKRDVLPSTIYFDPRSFAVVPSANFSLDFSYIVSQAGPSAYKHWIKLFNRPFSLYIYMLRKDRSESVIYYLLNVIELFNNSTPKMGWGVLYIYKKGSSTFEWTDRSTFNL